MSLIHPVTATEPRDLTGSGDKTNIVGLRILVSKQLFSDSLSSAFTESESDLCQRLRHRLYHDQEPHHGYRCPIVELAISNTASCSTLTEMCTSSFWPQHVGVEDDSESCFSVIALGEEFFGEDLDALRRKEITVPEYLKKLAKVLEGPDVYKLYGQ